MTPALLFTLALRGWRAVAAVVANLWPSTNLKGAAANTRPAMDRDHFTFTEESPSRPSLPASGSESGSLAFPGGDSSGASFPAGADENALNGGRGRGRGEGQDSGPSSATSPPTRSPLSSGVFSLIKASFPKWSAPPREKGAERCRFSTIADAALDHDHLTSSATLAVVLAAPVHADDVDGPSLSSDGRQSPWLQPSNWAGRAGPGGDDSGGACACTSPHMVSMRDKWRESVTISLGYILAVTASAADTPIKLERSPDPAGRTWY